MDILQVVLGVVVVLYSVILHEISHGLMALSLGDQTAKQAGRLTLNPLRHLDLFGSLLLPLVTWFVGHFIFGYAKPVPYNPLNLRDQRYGPAKVAAAGPLSNLLLAVLFGLVLRWYPPGQLTVDFANILGFAVKINLMLAIFNLIPIQPLDGHWLLLTFLPQRWIKLKYFLVRYGVFLFILFVLFFFPLLLPLIQMLFRAIVGS